MLALLVLSVLAYVWQAWLMLAGLLMVGQGRRVTVGLFPGIVGTILLLCFLFL
jgi:hypothetical protein